MKRLSFSFFAILFFVQFLSASNGDTTTVRVFNKLSMNHYGNFDGKVKLPDASKKYQRIWLKYTLGCESNGQCEWDYTLKLFVRQHTGKNDSTLKQAPYLKVNGNAADSIRYSTDTTWVNAFNSVTKKTDSVPASIVKITLFNDSLHPLVLTDSINGFSANYYRYQFDSAGKKTDSVWVASNQLIRQKFTPYHEVFEMVNNYELGRFISPYAKTFPKTFKYDYVYDVTDFVSLFNAADSAEFRIEYQGYSYGFTATWDMIYVEGTPAREVTGIEIVYNGGFDYGQSTSIETKLTPASFAIPAGTLATKARILITGHGMEGSENCAEFCPKNYYLKLNNKQVAQQLIWKDDCGSNAISAQPGTWVYDRANWCPGEKVRNLEHWINPVTGATNTIDLDLDEFTASGGASYNISLLLIHYKANSFENDAAIEDIIAPSRNQWHNRVNPVCDHARIMIKNWGSKPLTRALISFRIGDGNVRIQEWAGNLAYGEETEAFLPYIDWPADLSDKTFKVWLSSVNGEASDENAYNNTMYSQVDTPALLPSSFIVETRTNNLPAQNNYKITDSHGKVHYEKAFTQASTTYRDTINLGYGCYTFKFNDEGGNGIDWWAAQSDGTGYVRIRQVGGTRILKSFNADFGNFTQLAFTVTHPVGLSDLEESNVSINVYPSPAKDVFFIEGIQVKEVSLTDVTGKEHMHAAYTENGVNVTNLPAGIFFVNIINTHGERFTKKITLVK